jgi:hypothetical protein
MKIAAALFSIFFLYFLNPPSAQADVAFVQLSSDSNHGVFKSLDQSVLSDQLQSLHPSRPVQSDRTTVLFTLVAFAIVSVALNGRRRAPVRARILDVRTLRRPSGLSPPR